MLLVKDQLAGPIEPLQACVDQAAELCLDALRDGDALAKPVPAVRAAGLN
jgi:hypothetical protein